MNRPWPEEADRMVRSLGPIPAPIAEAMRGMPRHEFVPVPLAGFAYRDEPVPLPGREATVSAPHMVALQLEAAELAPGDRVLEVGSGSGYLLALARVLVGTEARPIGYEVDPGLVRESRATLRRVRIDAEVVEKDGRSLRADDGPFDAILVSCAVPDLAAAWRDALAEGGRLVAPVGSRHEQVLTTYRSTGGTHRVTQGPACRFVGVRPHI